MIRKFICSATMLGLLGCACAASGTDLIIHLPGNAALSRKSVEYRCDGKAAQIGLPAGPFSVEYINGGGNSLAIVPISGNSLIFSNVMSGSGARYTTQQYTWWEAKGMVTLLSDSLAGKMQSTCRPVKP
jgi:membrane-bound inhibitor of C-type lysozyme